MKNLQSAVFAFLMALPPFWIYYESAYFGLKIALLLWFVLGSVFAFSIHLLKKSKHCYISGKTYFLRSLIFLFLPLYFYYLGL